MPYIRPFNCLRLYKNLENINKLKSYTVCKSFCKNNCNKDCKKTAIKNEKCFCEDNCKKGCFFSLKIT